MGPLEQEPLVVEFVVVSLCVGFCQTLLLYQDYAKRMKLILNSGIRSAEATVSGLSAQRHCLLYLMICIQESQLHETSNNLLGIPVKVLH